MMPHNLTSLDGTLRGLGPALANHLWQSTVFAAVVWGLTLLMRKNSAQVRFGLWLAASIKFLLPFSLLIALGGMLPRPHHAVVTMPVYSAVDTAGLPFSEVAIHEPPPQTAAAQIAERETWIPILPLAFFGAWLCGVAAVLLRWTISWGRVTKMRRSAAVASGGREVAILRGLEAEMADGRCLRAMPLLLSADSMEPGVLGVFRPVVLWPAHLSEHLDDEHMEAILAHELMHVRRRDNLTAALHMLVQTAFWFHPAVWWMGRQMVAERELACDEAVVALGNRRGVYAEGLLKTVRFCVESPLACAAGITGADLKKRVHAIMRGRLERLGWARKTALALAGVAAIAAPVAFGMMRMIPIYGQISEAAGPLPSFEVATIKPSDPARPGKGFTINGRHFSTLNTTASDLLQYAYEIQARQIVDAPGWLDADRFDITGVAGENQPDVPNLWNLMTRKLLADRFRLTFHHETRELPVYELRIGKNGPKLARSAADDHHSELYFSRTSKSSAGMTLHAKDATMAGLAKLLQSNLQRPVIDRTGLTGTFDFTMDFTSDTAKAGDTAAASADAPSIFTAIQEQIGLKLEPAKGPVDAIAIDHIEKPVFDSAKSEMVPAHGTRLVNVVMVQQRSSPAPAATPQGAAAQGHSPQGSMDACPDGGLFAAYDVVSVRPTNSIPRIVGLQEQPDGIRSETIPVAMMVQQAYSKERLTTDDAVAGLPDWAKGEYFAVNAKMNPAQVAAFAKLDRDQQRGCRIQMLRSLLTDRFKVQVHAQSRQVLGYDLVVASGGPKMKEVTASDPDVFVGSGGKPMLKNSMRIIPSTGGNEVEVQNFPLDQLAAALASPGSLDHKVVNKTGLTGMYRYTLTYALQQGIGPAAGPEGSAASEPAPTVFNAVEDQLGLKLQRGMETVEIVAVDHIERPTAN